MGENDFNSGRDFNEWLGGRKKRDQPFSRSPRIHSIRSLMLFS